MAYDATHGFTVQEATNLLVYDSYKCEILTLDGAAEQTTASWDGPAKEIQFYSAGSVADDNLPFSVKGILMEQIKLTGGSGDDDVITVLSFH